MMIELTLPKRLSIFRKLHILWKLQLSSYEYQKLLKGRKNETKQDKNSEASLSISLNTFDSTVKKLQCENKKDINDIDDFQMSESFFVVEPLERPLQLANPTQENEETSCGSKASNSAATSA